MASKEAERGRSTQFRDVCGSVDELKRALHEEPDGAAAEPAPLESLVDDALYMLRRMELRRGEYEAFRERVQSVARSLEPLAGADLQAADRAAVALKMKLGARRALSEQERDAAVADAEAIRDVAQATENTLNRYKELAIELERAYRDVRGDRVWVLDQSEAEAAAELGEPEWVKWLPPSPHRERILRWVASGRAHVLAPAGGDADVPPQIQFQDGGVMELTRVRWSDEVRSFYSTDNPPDPRGRLYRDYAGRRVFPGAASG